MASHCWWYGGTVVRVIPDFGIRWKHVGTIWNDIKLSRLRDYMWLLCFHSLSMSSMNWRLPNHRKLWSENLKQFDHESKSHLRFFLVVIKMVYLYMCVTEPYLLIKQKLYIRSVSTVEGILWSKETHRRDRLHQCSGLVNIEDCCVAVCMQRPGAVLKLFCKLLVLLFFHAVQNSCCSVAQCAMNSDTIAVSARQLLSAY